jgi:JAB1/Mov34/MPN/PAD-1 ubiquitin protease
MSIVLSVCLSVVSTTNHSPPHFIGFDLWWYGSSFMTIHTNCDNYDQRTNKPTMALSSSSSTTTTTTNTSIRHNPALLLDVNTSSSSVVGASMAQIVTIHPLVLMSILDHHMRRQEMNGRVIGTLLGRRNGHMVCC